MNASLLSQVAWIGDKYVAGPIRGVILRFPGLGATGTVGGADPMEMEWGQAGGLVVTPYQDPWGWMNAATRAFTDELVSGIFARFGSAENISVIATGGSMGGHNVDYREQPGMGYCGPFDWALQRGMTEFALE